MEIPEGQDPNAGILFIPETIEFPEQTDEERAELLDGFLKLLEEHLRAPLDERGPPTTMIPLIVRTEADFIEVQAWMAAQAAAVWNPRAYLPIIPYDEWLVRGN